MSFSVFRDIVEDTGEQRRDFFKLLFGKAEGYVCVAYLGRDDKKMHHRFFKWPGELEQMLENIEANVQHLVHAYFGVSIYKTPDNRTKNNIKECTNIWADLDTADPRSLLVRPSILIQSSPGKYQALWLLQEPIDRYEAEEIARKISYAHADDGADKCWDASHVLRIPYTPNLKYGDLQNAPIVGILHAERYIYRPKDFNVYPTPKALRQIEETDLENRVPSESNLAEIEFKYTFSEEIRRLIYTEPDSDWSSAVWNLIRSMDEIHVDPEEMFVVVKQAACNKYRRDGRSENEIWRDIDKATIKKIEVMRLAPTASATVPKLMTSAETTLVLSRETFVERYIKWASNVTDAAVQYHQSGAFIILSSLLAGNIKLPTSFGRIIPNLWFMLLGNTTLTRKTTAMNMAMSLLYDVDERALLATDGSMEGILVGMRDRPKQPSIFLRDEFSGLLEVIAHKDYMAGFAEQLTKLYDGEPLRRLLRKETIDIKDPIFIMYVGGIKDKTQMLLTEELVMGGFMPRFVLITAEPDMDRIRPIGPPVETDREHREFIKNELFDLFSHYVSEVNVVNNGQNIGRIRNEFTAVLTPEAWKRYNDYEFLLTRTALDAGLAHLTPVYDRLAKSTLKAAILIAASTQREQRVVVTLQDLLHAIYYAQGWREYASEIVNGVGKTYDERIMDRLYRAISASTTPVPRGELMRIYQLDYKRADLLFRTMEQRGIIMMVNENGIKGYRVP